MSRNHDIVCIAPQRWDSPLRRRQQVMARLAERGHRVFYLSFCLKRWRDQLAPRLRWLRAYPPALTERQPGIYELPLFNLLPNRALSLPGAHRANDLLLQPLLCRLAHHLGHSNPILWFTFPTLLSACQALEPRLVVYDRSDRWPDYFHRDEQQLLKRADLVFATARSLAQVSREFNDNVHLIPNAVDVEHFRRAMLPETEIPADVAALPRPVAGLVGALNAKVDTGLLERLARAHPDWSIVLVGPVLAREVPLPRLQALPNVHLLGHRPPHRLPNYLKAFDVALIPYVLDERTAAINPLKLYEYLAAGRPVVATALPELEPFRHLVRVAQDAPDFVAQVELALAEDDPSLPQQRLAAVQGHTWNQRVAMMIDAIRPLLASRRVEPCDG